MKNSAQYAALKKTFATLLLLIAAMFSCCCSNDNNALETTITTLPTPIPAVAQPTKKVSYLALGDSYTIGQSVCETCRFPEQLKKKLENTIPNLSVDLKIIAQTGWTTSNLKNAIKEQNPSSQYHLVTLLIGVNNQYQNREFILYENEFPELVNKAIELANGDKTRIIVISIPDYAYTPFGQRTGFMTTISSELDRYNDFAKKHCLSNGISFVNITDITRMGLKETYLVASDGLHPSEKAYSLFVDRILPIASTIVQK